MEAHQNLRFPVHELALIEMIDYAFSLRDLREFGIPGAGNRTVESAIRHLWAPRAASPSEGTSVRHFLDSEATQYIPILEIA